MRAGSCLQDEVDSKTPNGTQRDWQDERNRGDGEEGEVTATEKYQEELKRPPAKSTGDSGKGLAGRGHHMHRDPEVSTVSSSEELEKRPGKG